MPVIESTPIKVTLTVEVDGHVLTFEETGKALGARYHGGDPRDMGYVSSDTLESKVRAAVHTGIAKAVERSTTFLTRAYPVHDDEGSR